MNKTAPLSKEEIKSVYRNEFWETDRRVYYDHCLNFEYSENEKKIKPERVRITYGMGGYMDRHHFEEFLKWGIKSNKGKETGGT